MPRHLWPSVQQVCFTVCVHYHFVTCEYICLLIAELARVSSTLLWTCIEEPPPVALLSDELLYCNGKNHLACPNSSLAVIVNQCEPLQERGSLFPFVVIAVTALQLLWSPACFTTPLLVHVNQKEETLFWHFSHEKGFVTWYFPMSRHLDVQVSLSESISLSYPCTSLSSNLQQSVYHLPGRIYSGILFVPTVYMVGITAARSPFMFMTCISLGSSLGSQPGRVWLDGYWEGGGRWWMKWMGRGEGSPAFMLNLSWQLPSRLWASNARLPMRKSAVILYSPCVGAKRNVRMQGFGFRSSAYCPFKKLGILRKLWCWAYVFKSRSQKYLENP